MYHIHAIATQAPDGLPITVQAAFGDEIREGQPPRAFHATFDGPRLASFAYLPDPPPIDGERVPGWEVPLKWNAGVLIDPPLALNDLDGLAILQEAQRRAESFTP